MLGKVCGGLDYSSRQKTIWASDGSSPVYHYNNLDDVAKIGKQILKDGDTVASFDKKVIPALLAAGVIYE